MPLLEARACGTRAAATDSPELREAGVEDTLYIQLTERSLEQTILEGCKKLLSHCVCGHCQAGLIKANNWPNWCYPWLTGTKQGKQGLESD